MTNSPPPGWYPEENTSNERWWDGQNWSESRRDAPAPVVPPADPGATHTAAAAHPSRRPVWPWVLGGSLLVIVAVLVAAVLVIASVFSSIERSSPSGSGHEPGGESSAPAGSSGDGIIIGDGGDDAIRVVTYVDYFCPYCGQFESTNAKQLSEWVDSGEVVLEVHPISILDRASLGTKYSTRAANAAACVADSAPDQFEKFSALLFENQPDENTEGLSDADLIDLANEAGAIEGTDVTDCIDSGEFAGWVTQATDRALNEPVPNSDLDKISGTPTVIVDGVQYTGSLTDAQEFADFVLPGVS
ncbi:Protein-disulfide isomerase [Agreia bicolorata]|uniref:Protein-disulfide isomerase n=1 Tax=Agreia bicolorata TaxID=110935 RepID=A0A1T4X586_9MICO|nr:thioredoxin domain-containing protein [Agreia bicolorata]SKA84716.1 Protein-disulfide isomerase [Agreia bicolorata]